MARANRLREIVVKKHDALERKDFGLAAQKRAQERAVYESFWLEVPAGESHSLAFGDAAEQIKIIGGMFRNADAAS